MDYKPWKDAIEKEVEGLALTSAQWMDVLMVGTSDEAYEVVNRTRVLYLETSPDQAMQYALKSLDFRFKARQTPSQHLINSLLHGPTISASKPSNFFLFAQDCGMAVQLQSPQTVSLVALEDTAHQDTIINRLDSQLAQKWHEYRKDRIGPSSP